MKHTWLSPFLDLPYGIPSHDIFRRVFSLVNPQGLSQCFRQWIATTAPPLPREVVAIDGKTVRRSFDCGRAQGPLHVVSTFATQWGLSLGQVGVVSKGQELTNIPLLIRNLYLANYDVCDSQHGRWVRCRAWVLPLGAELAALRDWPGLRAVIAVETIRQVHHQPGTQAPVRWQTTSSKAGRDTVG